MPTVTLADYLQREEGKQASQSYPAGLSTQVNIQLNEFNQSFSIPAPQYSGYLGYPIEPFLDIPDLLECFEFLRERLGRLNARIDDHHAKADSFERQLYLSLGLIREDLDRNLNTFQVVEENAAAAARRTFLQSESIRLEQEINQLRLKELDRIIELERQRDELLPQYIHLRRVVRSLD